MLDEDIAEKWDIYKQCEMNFDIIIQIFSENKDEHLEQKGTRMD